MKIPKFRTNFQKLFHLTGNRGKRDPSVRVAGEGPLGLEGHEKGPGPRPPEAGGERPGHGLHERPTDPDQDRPGYQ